MSDSNKNIFNIIDEINWPYVVKKEARGIDDADFGEVQEIVLHYILTEKGIINKETFYLPTELVEEFDGENLRFSISEQDANEKFKRGSPPSAEEYSIYKKKDVSMDKDEPKKGDKNDNNIAISLNPDISLLKEKEDADYNAKINFDHQNNILQKTPKKDDSPPQDKKIIEKIQQEVEDKYRLEAEKKAQSIAQQIQDKAKMDAERKAQSIIQQAEDKARAEAERRSKEITQQAEDKARAEAERRSKEITQQAEDKARAEAERRSKEITQQAEDKSEIQVESEQIQRMQTEENITSNENNSNVKGIYTNPFEKTKPIEKDIYNDSNSIFNPFEIGITMWQNYNLFFLNLTKEFTNNTTKITKDIEKIIKEFVPQ